MNSEPPPARRTNLKVCGMCQATASTIGPKLRRRLPPAPRQSGKKPPVEDPELDSLSEIDFQSHAVSLFGLNPATVKKAMTKQSDQP